MRRFFADTFYWVALLFRRDTWHDRVTAFSHTLSREDILYTTYAVVLEFLAAFSAAGPYLRQQATARVEEMLSDPSVRVVEVTRARLLEGLALYKARPDKAYSLTDCVSMQVIRRGTDRSPQQRPPFYARRLSHPVRITYMCRHALPPACWGPEWRPSPFER